MTPAQDPTPAPRVLVPLAEGFEEIEAVAIVDVLRRAGVEVTLAGLETGRGTPRTAVRGAHGIELGVDALLDELEPSSFDMVVLPGGMPGTTLLMQDERVLSFVRALHAGGARVAAVCAAPMVLAAAGVLTGVPVTSHPSVRTKLGDARVVDAPRVVRSGRVITSQGPGTSIEFALALVEELVGTERAAELARTMLVHAPS